MLELQTFPISSYLAYVCMKVRMDALERSLSDHETNRHELTVFSKIIKFMH